MRKPRPIIRYHGGKHKLAEWIISYFPDHRIYVEPFGGAASVLIRKPRAYAEVYNDLDNEIVNLFQVARDDGLNLKTALELTPFSRVEFQKSYLPSDIPLEQARRTVVRAFQGFGSNSVNKKTGFWANSNRSGTTPSHDWRNYPAAFPLIVERLQGVVIENRDACEVMLAHDSPETLHYVDPPYAEETRDKGGDYKYEMQENGHEDLAIFLKSLKGMVILSGYPSKRYDDLFKDWHREDRAALADGAKKRIECLWFSPNFPLNRKLL